MARSGVHGEKVCPQADREYQVRTERVTQLLRSTPML